MLQIFQISNHHIFLLIIPLYYLISLFFFCFPNLLWKKIRYRYPPFNKLLDSDKIFTIGHRGGAQQGTQNTLQCFEKNDQYCDMFELDVRQTKDKILVVHHDGDLQRTCGINQIICNLNYDQLPNYQKYFKMHFTQQMGIGFNNKIPKLQDVFMKFPEKIINIQLKSPTDSAIKQLSRLVKVYNRQKYTIWGIITKKHSQLKKQNPDVQCFYSAKQILKIIILYISGLLPFWCLNPGFFQIFMYNQQLAKMAKKNLKNSGFFKKTLFYLLLLIINGINCILGPLIKHLKKRGIITFLFVLNNQGDYAEAISKGCCGIMTDRPKFLYDYLVIESLSYLD